MKKTIVRGITVVLVLFCIGMGFVCGIDINPLQHKTLRIIITIAACSAAYCFLVGELSGNNSQMDKLWSLLPIVYAWVIAALGDFAPRLLIMAVLITAWGGRLTYNFAKKGAYSIRFWAGEEDYRWKILRGTGAFRNKIVWAVFDLLFISIYQNALVVAICFPMVALMTSAAPIGVIDLLAAAFTAAFIAYETVADLQQMRFQTKKWSAIKNGKRLEELTEPYSKGFNTLGLWSRSRHPNYLAEQMIWLCLYLFVIGAGVTEYGVFHWTIAGPMLLVFLFMGSSTLAENISISKYPEYRQYQEKVYKYLPLKRYG